MSNFNKLSAVIVEQVGNRLLNLDAEANSKLKLLTDKIIHIQITDLELNFYFLFPSGSLIVLEQCERNISASITGRLNAFIATVTNSNSGDAIFTGDLHFSGEINTARAFQEFVQSLEIDWQQPLSQVFGDVIGYNIGQGISRINQFFSQIINNARQDIPEYLQHEVQLTLSKNEIQSFFEQVDLTRSQTDRLAARIQRLRANN